jgi:hypothetical protein
VPRLEKPLHEWDEADVLALIEERVEEGQRLEYKRELTLATQGERLEAAKDASGLANATGGLLIYGVAEEEADDGRRLPVDATPLEDGDAQARLEDVLHSVVSPSLNFVARTLDAPDGGYFVLVRVQQRSGPLHMVEGYGQNRYFVRTGLSTSPMQAHEVERAFRELAGADARVGEDIARLPLVARIAPGRNRVDDRDRGVEPKVEPWFGVVSAALDAGERLLPMRQAGPQDFPADQVEGLVGDWRYIRGGGFAVDALGYVDEEVGENNLLLYRARLFRTGVFEWGIRYGGEHQQLPSVVLVENAHDALRYFANIYSSVGYFGCVRIWIRIENADQSDLAVRNDIYWGGRGQRRPQVESVSYDDTTNVETLLADPMPLVHASMDLVWQAFGYPRCLMFVDGRFEGRR